MPRNLFVLVCFFLAQAWSGVLFAQQQAEPKELKFYDVEIIIFKNLNVPRGQELNLPTPMARKPASSLDLFDPESVEKSVELGFTPLSSEELRLMEIVNRITRSSRYGLLLHTGWRQPGLEQGNTLPVWIRGGELFDGDYQSIDQIMVKEPGEVQIDQSTAAETSTMPAESDAVDQSLTTAQINKVKMPSGLYELEGQITITLARYLHTEAELILRKPGTGGSVSIPNGDPTTRPLHGNLLLNYALSEKRRMRSKRLHYLDHPEFGMLVLITPYEEPSGEAPAPEREKTAPVQSGIGTNLNQNRPNALASR